MLIGHCDGKDSLIFRFFISCKLSNNDMICIFCSVINCSLCNCNQCINAWRYGVDGWMECDTFNDSVETARKQGGAKARQRRMGVVVEEEKQAGVHITMLLHRLTSDGQICTKGSRLHSQSGGILTLKQPFKSETETPQTSVISGPCVQLKLLNGCLFAEEEDVTLSWVERSTIRQLSDLSVNTRGEF